MIQNKEGTVGKSLLGQERFNKKEHKTQRHTQPELQRQRTHTYCAATETHSNTRSCTLSAHTHRKKHTLTHRDKKNDTHAGRNIHNDENTEKDESTHTHTHLWSIKHCTSWSYINGRENDRASKLLAWLSMATVFWRLIIRKCSQLQKHDGIPPCFAPQIMIFLVQIHFIIVRYIASLWCGDQDFKCSESATFPLDSVRQSGLQLQHATLKLTAADCHATL